MLVIDNFIKDHALLGQIDDRTTRFWEPGYCWWQSSSPSINLRHKLIDYIWLQGRVPMPENFQGFEHWIGIYDAEGKLNTVDLDDQSGNDAIQPDNKGNKKFSLIHHFDKDEYRWHASGKTEVVSPSIGCIYYPPIGDQCEGGYLRLYDTQEAEYDAPYELIAPKHNRLIVFNPGKLHAVEQVTKGKRYAIAINVWEEKLSNGQMAEMVEAI